MQSFTSRALVAGLASVVRQAVVWASLRRTVAAAVLVFALVLAVQVFFVGNTGVYNDDYFWNQATPGSGRAAHLILHHPWHMWRPLARTLFAPLVTLLWRWPVVLHAIDAGLHGFVVWLIYRLLSDLGIPAAIAAGAALGFMIYPVHFEAVLWIGVTPTLAATALVLLAWVVFLWWIRSERLDARWGMATAGLLGALTYGAAAFNEQPAGAVVGLALVPFVIPCKPERRGLRRLVRRSLPLLGVGLGLVIYFTQFLDHARVARAPGRGTERMFDVPIHFLELLGKMPKDFALWGFARGAMLEGENYLALHAIRGLLALGTLALSMAYLRRSMSRRSMSGSGLSSLSPAPGCATARGITLLGIVWFISCWVPVAFLHSGDPPRLYYVSSIGLVLVFAAGAKALRPRLVSATGGWSGILGMASWAVRFAAITAALMLWIGVAAEFQRRYVADRAEIAPLVAVFGGTLEPGSILVPTRINSRTATTGDRVFDGYFQDGWFHWYAAGWRAQAALSNTAVFTVHTASGALADGLYLSPQDPEHLGVMKSELVPPMPKGPGRVLAHVSDGQGWLIPWDRIVFFEIDRPGNTRIVTRLRLHIPGGAPIDLVPRQVTLALAASARDLPEFVLDVYPEPASSSR